MSHCGDKKPTPISHDLSRLTPAARDLFDDPRNNRIRAELRLEPEHVGYQQLLATIAALAKQSS